MKALKRRGLLINHGSTLQGLASFKFSLQRQACTVRLFGEKSHELGVSINDIQDRREGPEYIGV